MHGENLKLIFVNVSLQRQFIIQYIEKITYPAAQGVIPYFGRTVYM